MDQTNKVGSTSQQPSAVKGDWGLEDQESPHPHLTQLTPQIQHIISVLDPNAAPFVQRAPIQWTKYTMKDANMYELEEGHAVSLVHYKGFNKLVVMPILKDGSLIHLADDIQLCQEKQLNPMTEFPEVGEIIIARYRMNGKAPKYHRCVVKEVIASVTQKILVHYLDAGEEMLVELDQCKHVDEAVVKHPVYARQVDLDGIPDMPENLMLSRVEKYLCKIVNKKLVLNLIKIGENETPLVKLFYGPGHTLAQKSCVNEEILKTGEWVWEASYERGNHTDDAIHTDLVPKAMPCVKLYDLPVQKVPLHENIPVQIVQYHALDSLIVIPLLMKHKHDLNVFQNQIDKYVSTVTESPHFPEIGEVVLLQDSTDPESKWQRGSRSCSTKLGDFLYAVDHGDVRPISCGKFRKIPFEFTGVGTFTLYASIVGVPEELLTQDGAEALERFFVRESIHTLRAESIHPSTAVVSFSCPNLDSQILDFLGTEWNHEFENKENYEPGPEENDIDEEQ